MNEQMIFRRYEIKYLITRSQQKNIINEISSYMTRDFHGHSSIQSLYYDTPDFLLARRSIEKPLYKEKLRLRSYGISSYDSEVFIEIKKKYEGIVYKRRISMKLQDAINYLTHNGQSNLSVSIQPKENSAPAAYINKQIFNEIDYFLNYYRELQPKVMLQYERDAYYGNDDSSFRVTFDDNICYRTDNLTMDAGVFGRQLLADDYVLMEVKVSEAIPLWFSNLLTQNRVNRTSFSKYGTVYILESGHEKMLLPDIKMCLDK